MDLPDEESQVKKEKLFLYSGFYSGLYSNFHPVDLKAIEIYCNKIKLTPTQDRLQKRLRNVKPVKNPHSKVPQRSKLRESST